MALANEIHARLRENAIDLGGNDLKPVQEAAAKHGVTIVMGLHEIDSRFSGTTLFNTVVVIGPDGAILNRHRKLMPTNPERMVWGMGDASGPQGRRHASRAARAPDLLGKLHAARALRALCPRHGDLRQPDLGQRRDLAGYAAAHRQGGGPWVIGTATALQGSDIPDDFPERDRLFKPEEWINAGDAVVIKPNGAMAAGPLNREKGILYADIDAEEARRARRSLDVCGHYARPDIFSLSGGPKTPRARSSFRTDQVSVRTISLVDGLTGAMAV